MSQTPPTCGMCKFRVQQPYQGSLFWTCGHKGGPDRTGRPGFVMLDEPPPTFCPRRPENGIWQTMISMFSGKGAQQEKLAKETVDEANRLKSQIRNDG
jgi:hypothetical protein